MSKKRPQTREHILAHRSREREARECDPAGRRALIAQWIGLDEKALKTLLIARWQYGMQPQQQQQQDSVDRQRQTKGA